MVILADVASQSFATLPWTKERSKCSIWSLLFLFGTKNLQDMGNFALILKICILRVLPALILSVSCLMLVQDTFTGNLLQASDFLIKLEVRESIALALILTVWILEITRSFIDKKQLEVWHFDSLSLKPWQVLSRLDAHLMANSMTLART